MEGNNSLLTGLHALPDAVLIDIQTPDTIYFYDVSGIELSKLLLPCSSVKPEQRQPVIVGKVVAIPALLR
jgi:hypothetical protein